MVVRREVDLPLIARLDHQGDFIVFAPIEDRRGTKILSVRDQNTFEVSLRKKRLMTLAHLFLIHRYKAVSVHFVSPTEDNQHQAARMQHHGLYSDVKSEIGHIIVATVDRERVAELLDPGREALRMLIDKTQPPSGDGDAQGYPD